MHNPALKTQDHKKTQPIRNIRAFVHSYLKGENGQKSLKNNKPFALAFAKAL